MGSKIEMKKKRILRLALRLISISVVALVAVLIYISNTSPAAALLQQYAEERDYGSALVLLEKGEWSDENANGYSRAAALLMGNAAEDYRMGKQDIRQMISLADPVAQTGERGRDCAAAFLRDTLYDITGERYKDDDFGNGLIRAVSYKDNESLIVSYLDLDGLKMVAEALQGISDEVEPLADAFLGELDAYPSLAEQLRQADAALKGGQHSDAYRLFHAVIYTDS